MTASGKDGGLDGAYNYDSTTTQMPFKCNSTTALRPFGDLYNDHMALRKSTIYLLLLFITAVVVMTAGIFAPCYSIIIIIIIKFICSSFFRNRLQTVVTYG